MRAWALILVFAAGCTDLSQRWELDHGRILAVRLAQPGLAADERSTVEVLVCDDDGAPAVVAPDVMFAAEEDPAVAGAIAVAPTADGWEIAAGDAEAIATARAAAGLADDAPLDVRLAAQVDVDGVTLSVIKRVRVGEAGANPEPPQILVDGASAVDPVDVAIDTPIALTLDGVPDDDTLELDWLTSTGTLTRSQTRAATLELAAEDPASGHVVALVRDDAGGVAWAFFALSASP